LAALKAARLVGQLDDLRAEHLGGLLVGEKDDWKAASKVLNLVSPKVVETVVLLDVKLAENLVGGMVG